MNVALTATALHPAAASGAAAAAAGGVEHQASSVDERGGLKMKIKRKNANGGDATAAKAAEAAPVDQAGPAGGKSKPAADGLRPAADAAAVSPRSKHPDAVKMSAGEASKRAAADNDEGQSTASKSSAAETPTKSKNKDAASASTLATGGRRSLTGGGGKAAGNGEATTPAVNKSKVKAAVGKASAKSKKAAAAAAVAAAAAASEDTVESALNGFESSADGHSSSASDGQLSANSHEKPDHHLLLLPAETKKGGKAPAAVDPYDFESVGPEVTSDTEAKPEVGTVSGRHLHRQQHQMQQVGLLRSAL